MEKKLIVGLGNIGNYYNNSRHNIGHQIIDNIAIKYNKKYIYESFGFLFKKNIKNICFIFMKTRTYMNLSGVSIFSCIKKENISINNIFIIVDDLRLNLGVLKIKSKGGCGGHNGLKSIQNTLNTSSYSRLRFGIGNHFDKGKQVDYVLGYWSKYELSIINNKISKIFNAIVSFGLNGIENTMNNFNYK